MRVTLAPVIGSVRSRSDAAVGETIMAKREETRRCALDYVRAMAFELKDIASANGAETLAHLLHVAALEAGVDEGMGAAGAAPTPLFSASHQPRKRMIQ